MTYTHKTTELPKKYDAKETEARLQQGWLKSGVYEWKDDLPRAQTYVIDTPPPTVSGLLHMGHVFSYTQADFIARYQRMSGKDVFYPMGFDDNGLPTERLVEKTKKIQAHRYISEHGREGFIDLCMEVSDEAREEFRELFQSIALSVDWNQEYHTISEESRALSQRSFLDLYEKGHVERKMEPMFWDPIDQTAIAQAEIEEKELDSHFNDIKFSVVSHQPSVNGTPDNCELKTDDYFIIGTTRPEMIPACVAIFYHPEDERYQHLKGKEAVTPLFGVRVPILEDDSVEMEKGTGIMMCCTFGDEADIEKWRKHNLPLRIVLNQYGKMDFDSLFSPTGRDRNFESASEQKISREGLEEELSEDKALTQNADRILTSPGGRGTIDALQGLKAKAARAKILELLAESGDLVESRPIKHMVKCAERSGAPIEILPTPQWFIEVLDKKDALKEKMNTCNWYPEWMKLRMEQWIDGLKWDWCISRQRYFGVPFPVWYGLPNLKSSKKGQLVPRIPLVASTSQLPANPLVDVPEGFREISRQVDDKTHFIVTEATRNHHDHNGEMLWAKGEEVVMFPESDVMDTWATSSISPQLSSRGISFCEEGQRPDAAIHADDKAEWTASLRSQKETFYEDKKRHAKLFPADLRPQAHEIIRTWAFYTIVKAHLHEGTVPWHNLMISGWCLAEDKTKMSKSKGNVVTPVGLIEEQGTDAVRYWASTSKLGTDTAFSTDLLKIGKKLVNKLWNATKFAAIHLDKLEAQPGAPVARHCEEVSPNKNNPANCFQDERDAATSSSQTQQIASPAVRNDDFLYGAAADVKAGIINEALDEWILTRLHRAIAEATASFEKYEYSKAREAAEDFFWNDFCDNYLELVKKRIYNEETRHCEEQSDAATSSSQTQEIASPSVRNDGMMSAVHTMHHCLDGILRLFAPFVPHITEELYTHIFLELTGKLGGSIHTRGSWPKADDYAVNEQAEKSGMAAVQVLELIRKAKSEANVSIKFEIPSISVAAEQALLSPVITDVQAAGNVKEIQLVDSISEPTHMSEDGSYAASIIIENTENTAA